MERWKRWTLDSEGEVFVHMKYSFIHNVIEDTSPILFIIL